MIPFSKEIDLEAMPGLGAVLGECQDFRSILGHQDRVFELSRCRTVSCSHRPAVVLVTLRVPTSRVDHRFDGKAHSGFEAINAALAIGEMGNRWIEMEFLSQSVANVFSYNAESASVSFWNNRFTDLADGATRRQCIKGKVQAIECTLRHTAALFRYISNQKCFTLVPVPSVNDRRDVYIDDVTILEHVTVWNAMADDIVDARATTFGIILVSQCCGNMAVIDGPLMSHLIDFVSRDACFNMWP